MELVDRYVHQVGRRLLKRLRDDVKAELRSLLLDALEERTGLAGGETAFSEDDLVAILEEFGPPAQMVAEYRPPYRCLIGPHVFDLYLIVIATVAGSQTLLYLLLLALIILGEPQATLLTSFGGLFDSYLGFVLQGFSFVTLTFAVLERVLPKPAFEEKDEETWDPRTLPEIQDRTRIEVRRLIVEIGLSVIGLIVFNFFPEWIGFNFVGSINGSSIGWHTIPLLSPNFFTAYLPLLNVLWIPSIGLKVILLRQGQWQRLTRLADVILTICGAFVLYRMISGPPILSLQAVTSESLREALDSILPGLLKVALSIGLLATIGEAIHKLYLVFQDHLK